MDGWVWKSLTAPICGANRENSQKMEKEDDRHEATVGQPDTVLSLNSTWDLT